MKPEIIGIGAQKCASSWIHAIAGSHPEIGTSEPKELDFFSYYFDRGYRWYRDHFHETAETRVRFENSPSYFHDPRAPRRAMEYRGDIKVVALLRDPIKRCYSNHLHEIIKEHIPPCPFEDGLRNNPSYVEQSLYATHLERWIEAVPKQNMMVLFAEDISDEPLSIARRFFDFLGVDANFKSPILHERRNESDRARSPVLRTTLRAGGDWMRRRGLEPALAKIKTQGPIAAMLNANRIQVRDEIPPMTPETVTMLEECFAPENERLRALLGRQTLPWDRARTAAAE